MVSLKERLRRPPALAVLLACAADVFRTVSYGELPWIALTLGFTFGLYGLIRKVAPVSSLVGLTIETLLLTGPGIAYLVYLEGQGTGALFNFSRSLDVLLAGTGVFTAVPLLCFNLGARRIHLSTLGLMQYIAPSGMFLLAVIVYGEPFTATQGWTFLMIWTALAIYSMVYERMGDKWRSHFYFGKYFRLRGDRNSALLHFRTALEGLPQGSPEREEVQRELKQLDPGKSPGKPSGKP